MRNGPIGRLRSRKGSRNREEYSRENWVVTQFNFANSCERTFPSSQRRGGRDINKMLRSILIYGADGVVRPAKRFPRSDHFYGFALSRSRFAPVCAFGAATPPLRGGEYSSQRKLRFSN